MRDITRDNLTIVISVIIYIVAGYCVQILYDIPSMMTLHFISTRLIQIAAIFSGCFIIMQVLRGKTFNYINRRSIIGFVIIVLLLPPFESTFASIKQVIPQIHDFSWDYKFMAFDCMLHFGHHPWRLLRPLLVHEEVIRAIDLLYMLWFLILLAVCLWMAWSNRRALRLQFLISSLIVWGVFGSVLGTIFSSAGPCYYSKVVNTGVDPYQSLMESLNAIHNSEPLWAVKNQIGLWEAHMSNEWLPFGGISAMPSIHVAMAVLFALLGRSVNHWLGVTFTAYAVIVQIGSVILGWHYAIDGYIVILLTILVWNLVGKIPLISGYESSDSNRITSEKDFGSKSSSPATK